jgi:hypothetical protein
LLNLINTTPISILFFTKSKFSVKYFWLSLGLQMNTFVENPYCSNYTYSCIIFVETPEGFEKVCQKDDFKTSIEVELWGKLRVEYYEEGYSYEVFQK